MAIAGICTHTHTHTHSFISTKRSSYGTITYRAALCLRPHLPPSHMTAMTSFHLSRAPSCLPESLWAERRAVPTITLHTLNPFLSELTVVTSPPPQPHIQHSAEHEKPCQVFLKILKCIHERLDALLCARAPTLHRFTANTETRRGLN